MRCRGRLGEALVWEHDRVSIGDLVLRLQYSASSDWDLGDRCLAFFKDRRVVELYDAIFSSQLDFEPQAMLELGIWDGGSVAFWYEYFEPHRLAAVDLQDRDDSAYFSEWCRDRGCADRIRTHWRTSQTSRDALTSIVRDDLEGNLDLVIDDASHLYAETLESLEILLPLLRPGGIYVIEDWNWGHWPVHFGLGPVPLTRLVTELVEALGTSSGVVARIDIYPDLAVLHRGPGPLPSDGSFRLGSHIRRRPRWYRFRSSLKRLLRGRFRR